MLFPVCGWGPGRVAWSQVRCLDYSFPRVDVTPAPKGRYATLKVRGIAETGAQVDQRSRPWPPLNRAAFPRLPWAITPPYIPCTRLVRPLRLSPLST